MPEGLPWLFQLAYLVLPPAGGTCIHASDTLDVKLFINNKDFLKLRAPAKRCKDKHMFIHGHSCCRSVVFSTDRYGQQLVSI